MIAWFNANFETKAPLTPALAKFKKVIANTSLLIIQMAFLHKITERARQNMIFLFYAPF